jgi:copper transport protein
MVDLSISPGRAGRVDIVAKLMRADFTPLDAKDVTLVLAQPIAGIEPFKRPMTREDMFGWRADGVTIPLGGVWDVSVDVLISDFEIVRLDAPIEIKP